MRSLFGKHKKKSIKDSAPTAQEANDRQINNLQLKVSVLEKKCKDITVKVTQNAKAGNKTSAIQLLKQKKMYEHQIVQLNGMISNLQAQSFALQNARLNKSIYDVIKNNNLQIKNQLGNITVDDIDVLRDDIEDTLDLSNNLSEALSQEIGNPVDMDEINDELEELMNTTPQEEEIPESKRKTDEDADTLNDIMASYA